MSWREVGAVFNLLDKGTFSASKFQQHSQSQSGLCYLTSYCYEELDILLNFLGKKTKTTMELLDTPCTFCRLSCYIWIIELSVCIILLGQKAWHADNFLHPSLH